MSQDVSAYWYKDGVLKPVAGHHIDEIIRTPELFGTTRRIVESTFQKYGEPLGHEGYAREELMAAAMQNGWIRVRSRLEKCGLTWIIQFDEYQTRLLPLKKLVAYLYTDSNEMSDDQEVLLVNSSGTVCAAFSPWNGMPVSSFL